MKTPFDSTIERLTKAREHFHAAAVGRGEGMPLRPYEQRMAQGMVELTDGMLDSFVAAKMQMINSSEGR